MLLFMITMLFGGTTGIKDLYIPLIRNFSRVSSLVLLVAFFQVGDVALN